MADIPPTPDYNGDPDRDIERTPRWVFIFAAIAIIVIVLFVVLLIAGGGSHGPGRHTL